MIQAPQQQTGQPATQTMAIIENAYTQYFQILSSIPQQIRAKARQIFTSPLFTKFADKNQVNNLTHQELYQIINSLMYTKGTNETTKELALYGNYQTAAKELIQALQKVIYNVSTSDAQSGQLITQIKSYLAYMYKGTYTPTADQTWDAQTNTFFLKFAQAVCPQHLKNGRFTGDLKLAHGLLANHIMNMKNRTDFGDKTRYLT